MLKLFWGLLCLLLHVIRFGVSQVMEMWDCWTQCSRSSSVSLGLIWNVGYKIFDFLSFCFHESPGVFKLHNVIWGSTDYSRRCRSVFLPFSWKPEVLLQFYANLLVLLKYFQMKLQVYVGTAQDVYVWVSDSIWHGIQECDDLL